MKNIGWQNLNNVTIETNNFHYIIVRDIFHTIEVAIKPNYSSF